MRWKRNNKERHRENARKQYERDPEKKKEQAALWAGQNPEKIKAKSNRRRTAKTQAGGSYTAKEWSMLCNQYGNKCAVPGCDRQDIEADHVVPVAKGGSSNINNIQPLCRYHNRSKGAKTIDYRTKPGIVRWVQKKLWS